MDAEPVKPQDMWTVVYVRDDRMAAIVATDRPDGYDRPRGAPILCPSPDEAEALKAEARYRDQREAERDGRRPRRLMIARLTIDDRETPETTQDQETPA